MFSASLGWQQCKQVEDSALLSQNTHTHTHVHAQHTRTHTHTDTHQYSSIALTSCVAGPDLPINNSLIGLSLVYCISLSGVFQYGVRLSTEVESLVSLYTIHCPFTVLHCGPEMIILLYNVVNIHMYVYPLYVYRMSHCLV